MQAAFGPNVPEDDAALLEADEEERFIQGTYREGYHLVQGV